MCFCNVASSQVQAKHISILLVAIWRARKCWGNRWGGTGGTAMGALQYTPNN